MLLSLSTVFHSLMTAMLAKVCFFFISSKITYYLGLSKERASLIFKNFKFKIKYLQIRDLPWRRDTNLWILMRYVVYCSMFALVTRHSAVFSSANKLAMPQNLAKGVHINIIFCINGCTKKSLFTFGSLQ